MGEAGVKAVLIRVRRVSVNGDDNVDVDVNDDVVEAPG